MPNTPQRHSLLEGFEESLRWKLGLRTDDPSKRSAQWREFLKYDRHGSERARASVGLASLARHAVELALRGSDPTTKEYRALRDLGTELTIRIKKHWGDLCLPEELAAKAHDSIEAIVRMKLDLSPKQQLDRQVLYSLLGLLDEWLGDRESPGGIEEYFNRYRYFRRSLIGGTYPADSAATTSRTPSSKAPLRNSPPLQVRQQAAPQSGAPRPPPAGDAAQITEASAATSPAPVPPQHGTLNVRNRSPTTTAHGAEPTETLDLRPGQQPTALTEAAPPAGAPGTSLWRFQPIADAHPSPRDERDAAFIPKSAASPEALGASVRGKKHKHEGSPCDDWFELERHGEWTLIAVSDGAGSRRLSRIGARHACRAAIDSLKRALASESQVSSETELYNTVRVAMNGAMLDARASVRNAAACCGADPMYARPDGGQSIEEDDLSCTLLIALHTTVVVGGKRQDLTAATQVGDGRVAVIGVDGTLSLLGDAASGEFSGETVFLNSGRDNATWSPTSPPCVLVGEVRALMVMTDGVADDYFPNDPGLIYLYADLVLNGILPAPAAATGPEAALPDLTMIASTATQLVGPSQTREHMLRSATKLAESLHMAPAQLLTAPTYLAYASQLEPPLWPDLPGHQRLKIWLDTYHIRGSFDDRTLVLVHRHPSCDASPPN